MSYTNIRLPQRWENQADKFVKDTLLRAELDAYKQLYEGLCAENENIIKAAKEFGYVDITVGNETVKLLISREPTTTEEKE